MDSTGPQNILDIQYSEQLFTAGIKRQFKLKIKYKRIFMIIFYQNEIRNGRNYKCS